MNSDFSDYGLNINTCLVAVVPHLDLHQILIVWTGLVWQKASFMAVLSWLTSLRTNRQRRRKAFLRPSAGLHLNVLVRMFTLTAAAPAATIKAGLCHPGSCSLWTRPVWPRQDVRAPLLLTTGGCFNRGPPYGENAHREYGHKAHTHTRRTQKRAQSGVAEWSRFRWKKFFLTSAGCWASAGSYRRGLCQQGRCWGSRHLIWKEKSEKQEKGKERWEDNRGREWRETRKTPLKLMLCFFVFFYSGPFLSLLDSASILHLHTHTHTHNSGTA